MTKEQILDKHLKTLIENDKDAWFKFEEMKTMPEYKAVLNAMTELETELVENNAVLPVVSNRFSPEQMAEWFHNNYEEIAKAEGWQTQDKCKVEFKDLPESNRTTMIKVCERWLNGC